MSKTDNKKGMSRRGFIKSAAFGAGALTLTGLTAGAVSAAPLPKKWEKEADVIVIGCGGSGVAAAIEAHDAGAKVLILEKTPLHGGSTNLSGGIVYAAGTSVQKKAGIEDSPVGMFKYWMAYHRNLLDPKVLTIICDRSDEMVEWLMRNGVEFPPELLYYSGVEEKYGAVTKPVKRGHCAKGRGKGLMDGLMKSVASRKIEILYNTPAERLLMDDKGEIAGVQAKGKKGAMNIKAKKAVILASGGFARNKEMVKSYFPDQLTAVPFTASGTTGDGILMAGKVGAPIVDTGTTELPPSLPALEIVPAEKAVMFSSAYFLYKYPYIWVNEEGKRFCDESAYYQITSPFISRQKSAYIVFDDKVKTQVGAGMGFGFSKDLEKEIAEGILKKAATLEELGKLLKVNPEVLKASVEQFSANAKTGSDPEFKRAKGLGAIETGPFYGGKLTVAVVESLGGLRINVDGQVLDAYDDPIPRLYAAGAVTATLRGYPGSGASITRGLVMGRVTGQQAAGEKARK